MERTVIENLTRIAVDNGWVSMAAPDDPCGLYVYAEEDRTTVVHAVAAGDSVTVRAVTRPRTDGRLQSGEYRDELPRATQLQTGFDGAVKVLTHRWPASR